jgi:hypothetical protein
MRRRENSGGEPVQRSPQHKRKEEAMQSTLLRHVMFIEGRQWWQLETIYEVSVSGSTPPKRPPSGIHSRNPLRETLRIQSPIVPVGVSSKLREPTPHLIMGCDIGLSCFSRRGRYLPSFPISAGAGSKLRASIHPPQGRCFPIHLRHLKSTAVSYHRHLWPPILSSSALRM